MEDIGASVVWVKAVLCGLNSVSLKCTWLGNLCYCQTAANGRIRYGKWHFFRFPLPVLWEQSEQSRVIWDFITFLIQRQFMRRHSFALWFTYHLFWSKLPWILATFVTALRQKWMDCSKKILTSHYWVMSILGRIWYWQQNASQIPLPLGTMQFLFWA